MLLVCLLLRQAKEPASTMKAFEALFDNTNFKKGCEVAFASHHKGQLVTQIDGKQVGVGVLQAYHSVYTQW